MTSLLDCQVTLGKVKLQELLVSQDEMLRNIAGGRQVVPASL